MSRREEALATPMPERHAESIPPATARRWLQRGMAMGQLLKLLARKNERFWHSLADHFRLWTPQRRR